MLLEVEIEGSVETKVLAPIGKKILRSEAEKLIKELKSRETNLTSLD